MNQILLLLTLLNIVMFIAAVRRSREPFGLPLWIGIYYLVYFGVGYLIFLNDGTIKAGTIVSLLSYFLILQTAVALSIKPHAPGAAVRITYHAEHMRVTWTLFVLIGIALSSLFYLRAQSIPLLAADPESARKIAIAGNGFFLQGLVAVLPAALLLGFNRREELPFYWPVFFFVVLGMIGLAFRGPVVFFIIQFAFMYYVTGRKRGFYTALGLSFVPIVLLISFITAVRETGALLEFARLLWTFKVNILNYQAIASVLDWNASFLIGKSYLMDLSILVPGDFFKGFGWWVTEFISASHYGISTPTLFGEALLNFGSTGACFYIFAIGLLIGYSYSRFRWSEYYRHRVLIPLCFIPMTRALTGGFSSVFIMLVLPPLFFYLVWDIMTRSDIYSRLMRIREQDSPAGAGSRFAQS